MSEDKFPLDSLVDPHSPPAQKAYFKNFNDKDQVKDHSKKQKDGAVLKLLCSKRN